MITLEERARIFANNWNRSSVKDAGDTEKRTYIFEGKPEQLDTLETMLCFIQYLGSIGHSTSFELFVDGDGGARLQFKNEKGKDLPKVNDNEAKMRKIMNEDKDIKSFSLG